MEYLKYGKSFLITILPVLIIGLLLSTLYYFDILGKGFITYSKLILPVISFLAGGIYLGTKAEEKGWLEGIKIGGIIIILLLLLRYLAFHETFSFKTILYYLILLSSSVFGSMIGISRRESKEKK